MTTGELGLVLLAGAAVVLAAIVAARVAHGIGLPGLLLFVGLGLASGEAGVGVRFDDAGLASRSGWGSALGYLGPRVPQNEHAGYVAGQNAWRFAAPGSPAARVGWSAQVPSAASKAVMKRW